MNVNDSILMGVEHKKPTWKKNKPPRRPSSNQQDLEPELSDFRQPIEPLNLAMSLFVEENDRLPRARPDNFQRILNLYETYGPDITDF